MPKIIENIENKICQAVIELIDKQGVTKTSMKDIARESGIAVGTLYNYFSNKEELIFHVIEQSWQKTFKRLDQILAQKNDINRIKKFVITLYREVTQRKGIGRELLKNNTIPEAKFKEIEVQLNERFSQLLVEFKPESQQQIEELDRERLREAILMTVIGLASNDLSVEKDIDFLEKYVERLLS